MNGEEASGMVELIDVGLIDEHPDNEYLFGMPEEGIESLREAMTDSSGGVACDAPVLVWDTGNGRYMVYSGHIRRRAFIVAGGKMIPAIVHRLPEKEAQRRRAVLGANLYGRNINSVNAKNSFYVARQIDYMKETLKMEGFKGDMRAELAKEFQTSRSTIQHYHIISGLPRCVKERLADGRLLYSVARNFGRLDEARARKVLSVFDEAEREGRRLDYKIMVKFIAEEKRRCRADSGVGCCREELHTACIDKKIDALVNALVEWEGVGYWNTGYMRRRFRKLVDMIECELGALPGARKK